MLEIDGFLVHFKLEDSQDFATINVNLFMFVLQESKINIGIRNIFCVLEKAEKKWWNKLLGGSEKTPHYVKVDWDKWVDMDDDAGMSNFYRSWS